MKRLGSRLAAMAVAALVAAGVTYYVTRGPTVHGPSLEGPMAAFDLFETPRPAPEITFSDAAGNSLSLGDFAGQVVLVNFWATWCAPCVREMPSLDRLQAALGGDDFKVVTLSLDRGGADQVEPFFDQHGIEHLDAYFDPMGAAPRAFEAMGLPTTVLVDGEGRWVGSLAGDTEWDSREAQDLIRYVRDGA